MFDEENYFKLSVVMILSVGERLCHTQSLVVRRPWIHNLGWCPLSCNQHPRPSSRMPITSLIQVQHLPTYPIPSILSDLLSWRNPMSDSSVQHSSSWRHSPSDGGNSCHTPCVNCLFQSSWTSTCVLSHIRVIRCCGKLDALPCSAQVALHVMSGNPLTNLFVSIGSRWCSRWHEWYMSLVHKNLHYSRVHRDYELLGIDKHSVPSPLLLHS